MAIPPQVNNDLTTIITAIITSSVLAAILTKVFDYFFNRMNYKRDYYKKIIDKRLEAYEILNKVLYETHGTIMDSNVKFNRIYDEPKEYYLFVSSLEEATKIRIWYSVKTALNLIELLEFLAFSPGQENIDINTPEHEFHNFGVRHLKRFNELKEKLESSILDDFSSLDDIQVFLKQYKN
jgi:hypothetical protein